MTNNGKQCGYHYSLFLNFIAFHSQMLFKYLSVICVYLIKFAVVGLYKAFILKPCVFL